MNFGKLILSRKYLKIGTIEDLIKYRLETESLVEEIASSSLPSSYGKGFKVQVFRDGLEGREHLVISKGEIKPDMPVLVRVHTECVMGDIFGSLRTRSGDYIKLAMEKIDQEGAGVLLYLRMEDEGQRLVNRVKIYDQIDKGVVATEEHRRTFRTDKKDYGVGAQILRALGIRKIRLMANNVKAKRVGLKGYGLEIVETVSLPVTNDPLVDLKNPQDSKTENKDGSAGWVN